MRKEEAVKHEGRCAGCLQRANTANYPPPSPTYYPLVALPMCWSGLNVTLKFCAAPSSSYAGRAPLYVCSAANTEPHPSSIAPAISRWRGAISASTAWASTGLRSS